ncbi:hypothetical protein [Streptomyces sp. NPDC057616]|uniref:hypothetical protein n=1 Tax=Streptomyces sp. NPDC057616 TaxID=3346183 RepID=UPI0036BFA457
MAAAVDQALHAADDAGRAASRTGDLPAPKSSGGVGELELVGGALLGIIGALVAVPAAVAGEP